MILFITYLILYKLEHHMKAFAPEELITIV